MLWLLCRLDTLPQQLYSSRPYHFWRKHSHSVLWKNGNFYDCNFDKNFINYFLLPNALTGTSINSKEQNFNFVLLFRFILLVTRMAVVNNTTFRRLFKRFLVLQILSDHFDSAKSQMSSTFYGCGNSTTSYHLTRHLLAILPPVQSMFSSLAIISQLWLKSVTYITHIQFMPYDHVQDHPQSHPHSVFDPTGYVRHPSVILVPICLNSHSFPPLFPTPLSKDMKCVLVA